MLVKSLIKFEKWIKIRIGEPLTAVDSNESITLLIRLHGLWLYHRLRRDLLSQHKLSKISTRDTR